MVNPSVAVENVNAVLFGGDAVAAVNTVIRAVIPLAREHKQTLCGSGERDLRVRPTELQLRLKQYTCIAHTAYILKSVCNDKDVKLQSLGKSRYFTHTQKALSLCTVYILHTC